MSSLETVVQEIAAEMRGMPDRGEVASYIPELARVDPNAFGLVVVTADGSIAAAGDSEAPFSIQSISKVFTLALALGKVGDRLWSRVGREPSGSAFNSIVQLEFERGIPRNPFINAGAIAVTDTILSGHQPREALGEILWFMRFLADDPSIRIDETVAASEQRTGYRNSALANYMKSFGVIENPVEFTLASIPITAPSPCRAGSSPWRGVFWLSSAKSLDRLFGGAARARPAHQCADAHVWPLRRLGGIRLSGGTAGKKRGRRRHPGDRAGQGLDRRVVAGPRRPRKLSVGTARAGEAEQKARLVDLRGVTLTRRRPRLGGPGVERRAPIRRDR